MTFHVTPNGDGVPAGEILVCKCQRSLPDSPEGDNLMLVYDELREYQWMGEITKEWKKRFAGLKEPKFFAWVRTRGREIPEYLEVALWRNW